MLVTLPVTQWQRKQARLYAGNPARHTVAEEPGPATRWQPVPVIKMSKQTRWQKKPGPAIRWLPVPDYGQMKSGPATRWRPACHKVAEEHGQGWVC
jgi:hypothetical protein